MIRSKMFFIFCFLLFTVFCFAQQVIQLENPSFEGKARHSRVPKGWTDCGFPGESPPDIQPGSFNVSMKPQDGETYLGLICRDNDSWEMIAQQLSEPLMKDHCYDFDLYICRSQFYLSGTKNDSIPKNHTTPCKLKIWGGTARCGKHDLLDETGLIQNSSWVNHKFNFRPNANYEYLLIEVFYKQPSMFPYNGNVLIDNASDIVQVECE